MRSFLRALALVPLPVLHALGVAVGWVAFAVSPTYRRRFLGNARQAGVALAAIRRAVSESGKLVTEPPRLWFGADVRVDWEGGHLIEEALASGRGILFLTPHLGCFEAAAR